MMWNLRKFVIIKDAAHVITSPMSTITNVNKSSNTLFVLVKYSYSAFNLKYKSTDRIAAEIYEHINTYINNRTNCFLFQNPIQLLTQGQWWSILSTHLLQFDQWCHLSGLNTFHMSQYRFRLDSWSPKWNPQKVGTWPGSPKIVWSKHQISINTKKW